MTFVSMLTQRRALPPPRRQGRLNRIDVLQAIRHVALDLDTEAVAQRRFVAMLGDERGAACFHSLLALVMTLCCHGRRPFVVGHPRSPLPSVTERHVLALLAAAQSGHGEEVDIRLVTLLPAAWRQAAARDLAAVAQYLACAGVPLAMPRDAAPPRCRGWGRPGRPRPSETDTPARNSNPNQKEIST